MPDWHSTNSLPIDMLRIYSAFFHESFKDECLAANNVTQSRFLCSENSAAVEKILAWVLQCCIAGRWKISATITLR